MSHGIGQEHSRASLSTSIQSFDCAIGLTRAETLTLFSIRVNRAPFSQASQHRLGRSPAMDCDLRGADI